MGIGRSANNVNISVVRLRDACEDEQKIKNPLKMPRNLVTAPAYIRFDYGSADEILITPADQMDALTLTFTEMFADQMTQASQSRADATIAGLNVEATISIATIGNMELFNKIFQGADDLSTGTGATRKVLTGVASRPGCPVTKKPTMIKLASCDGESIDTEDWFFLPSAALFTNNTSFTFGNADQSAYTVTLSAFDPEATSIYYPYKVLRGDLSVIPGAPSGGGGGGTPVVPTFDTTLTTVTTQTPVAAQTVTFTATQGDTFKFNARTTGDGTPRTMLIFVAGTQVGQVDFTGRYIGDRFTYTRAATGITYSAAANIFTSGNLILT